MINYNPKAWFTFIFHIHKADTIRRLWPLMLSIAVFSGLIAFLELSFFRPTLPIGWVFSLGYFVVPIVPFILYVLASLELIAEEIEDPFGNDPNDLPVDSICDNIEKHVGEILR